MKSDVRDGKIREDGVLPLIVMTVILLLLGAGISVLLPFIISMMLSGVYRIAGSIGTFGPTFLAVVIGVLIIALIVILRQNEFAATVVIATSIVLDWYFETYIVALLLALILLLIFFLTRSSRYPWAEPRAMPLWIVFLVLAIFPAIRGAITSYDAIYYYPHIILGALIMFWLGTVLARDVTSIRRFFSIISVFGTLLAIHGIIQTFVGIFLFDSSSRDAFLASVSGYQLFDVSGVHRIGSFFVNPDWSGAFFATMLCIPLGLFVESSSFKGKLIYLSEINLIAIALLFTYSVVALMAACIGIIACVIFLGNARYRFQLSLALLFIVMVMLLYFSTQVGLFVQHTTNPGELSVRIGGWQTAIRVINGFPLSGVGLGLSAYLLRSEPYIVATQNGPLAHPHNSYLELGAMGGLPLLIIFLALLFFSMSLAFRNWILLDVKVRPLLGGGIAAIVALSGSSIGINGWTLPPLAAIGWLLLGVVSSPLLRKSLSSGTKQKKD